MKNFLTLTLLLGLTGPALHAEVIHEVGKYCAVLAEPVPVIPIPLGKTDKELTPAMSEALAALKVDLTSNRLLRRYEFWNYPAHPSSEKKSLHQFWVHAKGLSPEEAIFAYTCLGAAAEDQIISPATLKKRFEADGTDTMDFSKITYGAYMLKLACRALPVRFSREPKAQADEMRRVTDAAVAAAVRRHKALVASREPDFLKKYDMKDDREATAAADKFPRPVLKPSFFPQSPYSEEAQAVYNRMMNVKGALQHHALQTEKEYPNECHFFARVFLLWIPGDKDRVRRHLIECGYTTPEARLEFWKVAALKLDYYYNETHLDTIRDLAKP